MSTNLDQRREHTSPETPKFYTNTYKNC